MKKKPNQRTAPKVTRRYIRRREAVEAARSLRMNPDGSRYVVRFSPGQRIQHLILLVSFTILGITGLAQSFYATPVGYLILEALGGIMAARQVHHVAAFIFGAESIYHAALFVYELYVYHKISKIWPAMSDLTDLIKKLTFNLGFSNRHPSFDRYNFEEKAEYWALVWGGLVMGATGLMQWFPIQTTDLLPGWVIPVARAFHQWEAILAVLAILTWHFYHTLIKTRNFSIFNGIMTFEQMKEEHPLELAYLEQVAALVNSETWPVLVEIPLEVAEEEPEAAAEEANVAAAEEEVKANEQGAVSKVQEDATAEIAGEPAEAIQEIQTDATPVVDEENTEPSEEANPGVDSETFVNESLSSGDAS